MKFFLKILFKAVFISIVCIIIYKAFNSSIDIYNNFAYDRAITRNTPYGYIPLLNDYNNYSDYDYKIKGGDYVYVENWQAASNGKIIFAKVRSQFNSGYINNRLLVGANINVVPIVSVLLLIFLSVILIRKVYLFMKLRRV
jgi:hypothetical protein